MALMLAYEESPTECQRLAANHGYKALCIQEVSHPEEPSFALYATSLDDSTVAEHDKEVVLVIRGTSSIHDVVTDIRAAPAAFPPTREEIMHTIYGFHSTPEPDLARSRDEHDDDVCIPLQIENTQVRLFLERLFALTKLCMCAGVGVAPNAIYQDLCLWGDMSLGDVRPFRGGLQLSHAR